MTKKRAFAYLVFSLLTVLAVTSHGFSQEITPKTLVLTAFVDGFVSIDYVLDVDSEFPTQNITAVFGQVLEDLLVVDADGLPLGYSLNGLTLSVHSLGTTEVGISYLTQDITSKQGKYWTISLDASIEARIILPDEAAIISLNKVPEMIETNNGKVTLLMSSGLSEVTYVVGVIGTQEHARMVLDDAEMLILQVQNLGVIVTGAQTKLQQAESAFGLGNYAEAETLGVDAKNLVIQINQTATQAQSKIGEAQNAIILAEHEKRTAGLNGAKDLLEQANTSYDEGDYSEALSLATQAITEAAGSITGSSDSFPTLEVAVVVVVLVVVGLVVVVKSRNRTELVKPEPKKRNIDIDRIFAGHKDLLPEEKQAIQFLVENNGESFEADLFDYVKLPRTTTWRMVKRLKTMNIITVTKFRRQNLVRIKTKYDIK